MNPSELERRLLEAFSEEAEERLESLFSRLNDLENIDNEEKRPEILEIVFREAHSLKGAARSVNLSPIEGLCQQMETVFGRIKAGELSFSPMMFDALHDSAKAVERYVGADEAGRPTIEAEMGELGKLLNSLITDAPVETECPVPEPPPQAAEPIPAPVHDETESTPEPAGQDPDSHRRPLFSDTVRISSTKLDSLLLKAEEMISVKQISGRFLFRVKEIRDLLEMQNKDNEWIRSKLAGLAQTGNAEAGSILESVMRNLEKQRLASDSIKKLIKMADQGHRTVTSMVDDLLSDMKKTTLQPFSTLFAILPRMVRELSKDRGKFIVLQLSGGEIEVDKRILERMKDPVIHLVRNAVDHGIESPGIRVSKGKPERGTITISASTLESNRVELTIQDDGGGFDISTLKAKALKFGIFEEKKLQAMTDEEAISLIFHSGLSTSPMITEISGRGLGMAIVKDTIESLGGQLKAEHLPRRQTTFRALLPITQATFRGILVLAGGHPFIIPDSQIKHVIRIRQENIHRVENKPIIDVGGEAVGLIHLHALLNLPPAEENTRNVRKHDLTAVILGSDHKRTAFVVDEVINEQEVLVKNLGKQLGRVRQVAGATVLGSGQVVPVLNVRELIASTAGNDYSLDAAEVLSSDPAAQRKRTVLVVEDSFTSRTLLKNILEASGYTVKTAINGEEGFTMLKSEPFDAVVSDVEMPRMNGFELTEKIRGDEVLSETPVILVTSLDSRRDRERGIDVGANAYIVKGSFDQSNLLEVLEQLI